MEPQDHPCEVLSKKGQVCKINEVEDVTEVYCTTPNACGYVSHARGEILVSKRVYRNGRLISPQSTLRIGLSLWNSMDYLTCCAQTGTEPHWHFKGWDTNSKDLTITFEGKGVV